jgi:hypothetical protein
MQSPISPSHIVSRFGILEQYVICPHHFDYPLMNHCVYLQYGFLLPPSWIRPVGEETSAMLSYLAHWVEKKRVRLVPLQAFLQQRY